MPETSGRIKRASEERIPYRLIVITALVGTLVTALFGMTGWFIQDMMAQRSESVIMRQELTKVIDELIVLTESHHVSRSELTAVIAKAERLREEYRDTVMQNRETEKWRRNIEHQLERVRQHIVSIDSRQQFFHGDGPDKERRTMPEYDFQNQHDIGVPEGKSRHFYPTLPY